MIFIIGKRSGKKSEVVQATGTSNDRSNAGGTAILLSKNIDAFKPDIILYNDRRLMSISYVVEDLHCIVFNIYAPNLAKERLAFFTKLNNIFEQVNHESDIIACGDFNCVLNKSIDRRPRQEHEDCGNRELISIIERHSFEDIWRIKNPNTIRYTFHRRDSKSRLDYFLTKQNCSMYPREDAGGLSREYVLRIPSVS